MSRTMKEVLSMPGHGRKMSEAGGFGPWDTFRGTDDIVGNGLNISRG